MTRAELHAAEMGRRAGDRFRTLGLPSRNPFPGHPALAAAWRRAYLRALRPARR